MTDTINAAPVRGSSASGDRRVWKTEELPVRWTRAIDNEAVRRRGQELIDDLHEMDNSKPGAAFNNPWLGQARDAIETAISVAADEAEMAK